MYLLSLLEILRNFLNYVFKKKSVNKISISCKDYCYSCISKYFSGSNKKMMNFTHVNAILKGVSLANRSKSTPTLSSTVYWFLSNEMKIFIFTRVKMSREYELKCPRNYD